MKDREIASFAITVVTDGKIISARCLVDGFFPNEEIGVSIGHDLGTIACKIMNGLVGNNAKGIASLYAALGDEGELQS